MFFTASDGRQVPFVACGEASVPSVDDLPSPLSPDLHTSLDTDTLKLARLKASTYPSTELTIKT